MARRKGRAAATAAAFLAVLLSLFSSPPQGCAGVRENEDVAGRSVIATAEKAAREQVGRSEPKAKGEVVVVSARDLPKGHALTETDVAVARMEKSRIPPGAVRDPKEAIGRSLGRRIGAGVLIQEQMLRAEEEVERGRRVTLAVLAAGLRVTAPGETLTAARVGGRVKAVNLATKRTVEGRLADERTVLLDF